MENENDFEIEDNIFKIEKDEIISYRDSMESSNFNSKIDKDNKNDYNENNTEGPINLIKFTRDSFILNEKAIDFLNSIDDPIIVVSVVGKARTGKSYLMNLLLNVNSDTNNKGFEVASTINSCTRGIWIWNRAKQQPNSKYKIIFIDSEGTNSIDLSTKTYDAKIFALIVLLSSIFLYNTIGNIDENSIGDLALAAHLSSSVILDTNNNEEAIMDLAPNFIWVLRDFSLDKVDPVSGEEITNDEYLELCLRNKIFKSKNANDNNIIRQNIIKFFKERSLVTLCRPIDDESKIQNLNKIPFSNLKPDFKEDFMNLKQKIFYMAKPKIFQHKKMTGKILANLLPKLIESINNGSIPNINSAWDNLIENEIYSKFEECKKLYDMNSEKLNSKTNESYNLAYKVINKFKELLNDNNEIRNTKPYYELYDNALNKLLKYIDNDLNRNLTKKEFNTTKELRSASSQFSKILDEKMYKDSYLLNNNNNDLYNDYLNFIKSYSKNNDFSSNNLLDNFIKSDLKLTKEILYYIKNNYKKKYEQSINIINKQIKLNEFDLENKIKETKYKEKVSNLNSSLNNTYNILYKDYLQKETEIRSLIVKYTKLMEVRDKYYIDNEIRKSRLKNRLKKSTNISSSINSYNNLNGKCSLVVEEEESKCYCDLDNIKCSIY